MGLKQDTIELLKNRPRALTYADIEADTGIKKSWLNVFAMGRIENPGVETVEKLRDYLITFKNR